MFPYRPRPRGRGPPRAPGESARDLPTLTIPPWLRQNRQRVDYSNRLPLQEAAAQAARQHRAVADPDDILIVAAGGAAGGYSVVIPGWSGRLHSQAVTKMMPPCPTCRVDG